MSFFKTKSSKKKKTSSWSGWESSYYGGFLPTLLQHPNVKLPSEIYISVERSKMSKVDRQLFNRDVSKLVSMVMYYYISIGRYMLDRFIETVSQSPISLEKTVRMADFTYYVDNIQGQDTSSYDVQQQMIGHLRFLASRSELSSVFVKIDTSFIEEMLGAISSSDLEIKELLENYRTSILQADVFYEFNVNPDDAQNIDSGIPKSADGNIEFMEALKRITDNASLISITEDSVKIKKSGFGSTDACDPDLLKNVKFKLPSRDVYDYDSYESMFGENYEELSRLISSHLLKTLDITFDPTPDTIKSTRQGKIDSNKLVCATAGDLNVYQRTEENQVVKPFKVVMLGDESGSMCTAAKVQAFIMEAYFNAFSEIMDEDDIYVYGHSGDDSPEIYVYNEPGVTDFKDRIKNMSSKCENYDSPVIEKIHERVRGNTDSPVLMLYFSDGAPAGYNYGGKPAEKELKRVSEKCKRDEFLVIGVGLKLRDMSRLYHFHTDIDDRDFVSTWRDHGKLHSSVIKATSTYNKAVKTVFC